MKQFFINNNSDNLLLFLAGWGCDEYEFEHLKCGTDVLIFYNYTDFSYDFDFSKYKKIDLLTFSAGVFVGTVLDFGVKYDRKIALSGNPYLFDEKLGLSKSVLEVLRGVTEDNCEAFARDYLVMREDEFKNFNGGKRTIEDCMHELDSLMEIYNRERNNINDIYDYAIMGDSDPLFNPKAQKEYYGKRLITVPNARHNIFFRINSYEDIFNLCQG